MSDFRCDECDKIFASKDGLRRHSRVEHDHEPSFTEVREIRLKELFSRDKLIRGFAAGFLLAAITLTIFAATQESVSTTPEETPEPVDITVLTCENCTYQEFRDTTDPLFETEYREVNYNSSEGRELIEKYSIGFIPAFIFDKDVENRANFTRINSTLRKFDDAYVLPDGRMPAAQRVSSGGFELR